MKDVYELIVIGGGPAGLAAAISAKENGLNDILILERDSVLGGILNQCIHNGFGLHHFKEELTGPEYAGRFIAQLDGTGIEVLTDAMALGIEKGEGTEKLVRAICPTEGAMTLRAKSVMLAMGCRERTRGAISIPGTRPAGILTAGAAQRYVNIEGYMVGRRVVILGSGDIGLIMARRMTIEGAKVLACVELMPYSGGLNRNIVQCLNDFDIPLYLSHTITEIRGKHRVEGVTVAKVGADRKPIPGTEMRFDCDTVLLSVGLVPENELSRQAGVPVDPRTNGPRVDEDLETGLDGVFACGNVLHVHDLVDYVSDEGARAGKAAAEYVKGDLPSGDIVTVSAGDNVGYTVPQSFHGSVDSVSFFFRVRRVFANSAIVVKSGGEVVARFKREHMAPGEMERITLPKVFIQKINNGELTISAEEA